MPAPQPLPAPYRPDPRISEIRDFIADPVGAADFPQAVLRFRNERWDGAVGLGDLTDEGWVRHFARFEPLPENPTSPENVVKELEAKLLPYCTHVGHPGYMGLITPSPSPVGVIADFVCSALNQNVGAPAE